MLDDQAYDGIVAWSASGDSFVVKDMNDFTKHVLPRNFRHSNFASFVRQLNKYDFHKVKNPDESGGHHVGEHLWEFQHPDFIRGREDLLENVKRKVPARKKAAAASSKANEGDSKRDESPLLPGAADSPEKAAESYAELKGQVASLTAMQEQMSNHINGLTKQYQGVIAEMLTFQKNMVQQDQLMQNLIQYLMNLEADRREDSSNQGSFLRGSDPFGNKEEAAHLIGNYKDVPKPSTSLSQMNEMSQRMASAHRPPQQSESSSRSNVDTLSTTSSTLQETSLTSSVPTLSPKSHASPSTNINLDPPLSPKSQRNARANGTAHAVKDGNSRDAAASFFHPRHHDAGAGSQEMLDQVVSNVANPSLAGFEKAGLKVFTVGTLQPRENDEDYVSSNDAKGNGARASASGAMKGSPPQDSDPSYGLSAPPIEELSAGGSKFGSTNASGGSKASSSVMGVSSARGAAPEGRPAPSGRGNNHLRVRRSTFVPGWAIPPRVLLVDDDAVCRRLSSKFLQVFGCSIDYAVDGVTAVNKMNLEKYDLVLMDIVMPNLDGVSATSLIRQFDPKTPIISMTSNSGPTELMNYISSGMNDILPKPFTKEGLLSMLEKHLIHLKTVQKMEDIPKSLGLGASSDGSLQSAPGAVATSTSNLGMTFHRSVPAGGGVDTGAPLMGHGPESSRQSVLGPSNGQTGDKSVLNPLAGMGFSDEEYIAMLQNLIAAGGTSDSVQGNLNNPAANFLGVVAGGDSGDGSTSKNSAPLGSAFVGMSSTFPSRGEGHHGRERSAQTSSEPMKRAACGGEDISNHGENKRSRFTELG
ncbi:hypothetical protein IE53DRAFT_37502 [Violaceomyces palustris]|uniref:Uncharacterized protein n=1 Tax=Violaceomyces palustris TaxID=1673888 RepID=A0ACD0P0Y4_9BASI|nr:hypothetical protein IE53DRAFT_37502 [Violaceomyces palustris]